MSIEIYYFSGTGNSLYVARQMQAMLPDVRLTPIVSLLERDVIHSESRIIGFVFPNFCLTIPIPMYEFLLKLDLSQADYLFAVCTRGGSPSQAFAYINRLIKPQGKQLQAAMLLTMPWNHPVGKENLPGKNTQIRIGELEAILQEKLPAFCRAVAAGEPDLVEDTDADLELSSGIKLFDLLVSKPFNFKSHRYMYQRIMKFGADETCSGCGTCETVCLSQKIVLQNGRPVWQEEIPCYACYACINYCPQQAVQVLSNGLIKSVSPQLKRYHHAAVGVMDIAAQRGMLSKEETK